MNERKKKHQNKITRPRKEDWRGLQNVLDFEKYQKENWREKERGAEIGTAGTKGTREAVLYYWYIATHFNTY